MKEINKFIAGILVLSILGVGCATIMNTMTQDIGISSQPVGAKVTINNKPYGMTPIIADLKRKDNHIIKIELDGFKPYETTLTRRISGWVLGNILFGGLIGLAVDAISGGLYRLTPDHIEALLQKEEISLKGDMLYMIVVLKPDSEWQKIGKLESIKK